MRDRLEEFLAKRKELVPQDDEDEDEEEATTSINSQNGYRLYDFLTQTSHTANQLALYKSCIADVEKLQTDFIHSPFVDKTNLARYESLVQNVIRHGVSIRKSIQELDRQAKKDSDCQKSETTFNWVTKHQIKALTSVLATATNDFLKCRSEYSDKMTDRLRRQLQVHGEHVTDELMNEILQKESYSVFTQDFIAETEDAEETLRALEERHRDILALEKNVTDVNLLFKEMNLLVSQQADTLDAIECHVNQAEVETYEGAVRIRQARLCQSKARWKKFCCGGVIAGSVVMSVVVIIVLVSLV